MDACDSDAEEMEVAPILATVEPAAFPTADPVAVDESIDATVNRQVVDEVRAYRGEPPHLGESFDAWITDVTVGDDQGEFALPVPVDRTEYDQRQTGISASALISNGVTENETARADSGDAATRVAQKTICVLHGALASGHRVAICVQGYKPKVTLIQKHPGVSVGELESQIRLLTGLPTGGFQLNSKRVCKSFGWQPSEQDPYKVKDFACIKVTLPTMEAYHIVSRKIAYRVRGAFEVLERKVDDTLRWFDQNDILPCSWVRVSKHRVGAKRFTYADVECDSHLANISAVASDTIPPVMICSFDCEMLRYKNDDAMPQADEPSDIVAVVSISLNRHGCDKTTRRNFVFSIGSHPPMVKKGTSIHRFKSELARINALRDLLVASGSLVLTGYNILNFDLPYLDTRSKLLRSTRFWAFGGFVTRPAHIKPRSLTSSALGTMETNTAVIDGVLVVCMLEEVKRRFQLAGYKLKDVSRHFLQAGPKAQLMHALSDVESVMDEEEKVATTAATVKVHAEDRRDVHRFLAEHGLPPPVDDEVSFDAADVAEEIQVGDFVCLVATDGRIKLVESMQKVDLPIKRLFDIVRAVVHGDPSGDAAMSEVDEYADVDALLPLELMSVLHVLVSLAEVARVTSCRISEQLIRGQGIKVFSAYVWFLHRQAPTPYVYTGSPEMKDIDFIGATVLKPTPGYYCDPIITLDFASLYPSIMRTWNLCMSSLDVGGRAGELGVPHFKFEIESIGMRWKRVDSTAIRDPDAPVEVREALLEKWMTGKEDATELFFARDEWEARPFLGWPSRGVTPGVAVDAGVWKGVRAWFAPAPAVVDTFVKAETSQGILPKLLTEILLNRKRVKKQMGQTSDHLLKAVLNQRQLALKVLANSIYGATGATKGYMTCPQIARSVTFNGRRLIEDTKTQVLAHPDSGGRVHSDLFVEEGRVRLQLRAQERCKIVYGDSVTGDTPIALRMHSDGSRRLVTFDAFSKELRWVETHGGKESAHVDADVWSKNGWTAIKAVLRHRVDKPLFRVCAQGGVVTCTEDHSLLTEQLAPIKPSRCEPDTTVLCSHWEASIVDTTSHDDHRITVGNAAVFGLFLGAGVLEQRSGDHVATWTLRWDDCDLRILDEYKNALEHLYSGCIFSKMDILPRTDPPCTALVARGISRAALTTLVEDFQSLCFDTMGRPHVPECLFACPNDVKEEYLSGVLDACGYVGATGATKLSFEHAITAQGMYTLLRLLGRTVTVEPSARGYTLIYIRGLQRVPDGKFHCARPATPPGDGYVYDLTTENHFFAAGVGSLVVHNTDSVMVLAPGRSVQQAWDLGEVLGAYITNYFPGVIELECEQIKCPSIFRDAKKNYIAIIWEPNKSGVLVREDDMLAKGNEIARRDHPPYVRESLKRALCALMFGGCQIECAADVHAGVFEDSLQKCYDSVKVDIDRLVRDEVPLEEFCLSKTLKKKEDYKSEFLPHYQVALRLPEWPTNVRVRFFFRQPKVSELHPKKMDETRDIKVSELAEDPDTADARGAKPWRHKALSAFLNSLQRPLTGGWDRNTIAPILQLFEKASQEMENQIKRQRTLVSMFGGTVAPQGETRGESSLSAFAPLPPRARPVPANKRKVAAGGGRGGRDKRPR